MQIRSLGYILLMVILYRIGYAGFSGAYAASILMLVGAILVFKSCGLVYFDLSSALFQARAMFWPLPAPNNPGNFPRLTSALLFGQFFFGALLSLYGLGMGFGGQIGTD